MNKPILMIRNLAIGMALWATAGITSAITLTAFPTNFNNPIGIDWYEPTSMLIMSVNYEDGSPNNLDLVDPTSGNHATYSTLSGLINEVKVATVRSSSCQGGFTVGDAFIGNGVAGQVAKVASGGAPVTPNFATLTGETALVRGSLFQDRFCAAGGDLIVVTGNEQDGTAANDNVGNVWRVPAAGGAVAAPIATIGTHLEGVTTVPNDPIKYGPLAGRILAGAEQFTTSCASPPTPPPAGCGPPNYDSTGGLIVAVNPNGVNDFFTIGGPGTVGIGAHTHYIADHAFHPEDLDVIRANAQFFGVDFGDGQLLTAQAADFAGLCGQVLITQEFPFTGTSGLSALNWNAGSGSFTVAPLAANRAVGQWEHVTFTSGADCFGLKVVKSPKQGDPGSVFTSGSQVSFSIVVSATGVSDDTNVVLTDHLPGNGGLVWSTATASNGAPCIIVSNLLTCQLGTVAVGGPVTVTVTSTATTPTAACQDQPNPDAHAIADHGLTADDSGFLTCLPGSYSLLKNPKGATYNIGDNISFSMAVNSTGPGTANNVVLNDPLPTLGNLNAWSITLNPGGCTISSNTLNCPFGNLANGQTRTVTVATNASGGADATACPGGVKLNNTATLTGTGLPTKTDTGDYLCTPTRSTPRLAVVKTPDGGTFAQGGAVSFTIVVSSVGQVNSVAHAVQLNDQLPTNGGLNWSGATVTTTQGTCNPIGANSQLTCSLGDMNAGTSVTVTVSLSSTPAAACQSQPNPHAIATSAPDNLIAQDSGSLTCTPPPTLGSGDTATIGFWANKNGQGVIACENGGASSAALGNWLASNFPNLFGSLAGKTNSQVAAAFATAKNGASPKTYAQVFGAALAVYVTSSTTGTASCVSKFGFNFGAGTGGKAYNVGSDGAAIGLTNNTSYTVLQLLQQANAVWPWSTAEANAINNIFDGINSKGDIN